MRGSVLGALCFTVVVSCASNETSPNATSSVGSGGSTGVGLAGAGGAGAGEAGGGGAGGEASGTGGAVDCDAKSDACASEFGTIFTKTNGRADGTLLALVDTTDTQCPLYNNDHVVVQMSIQGGVQRLVVSVDGVLVTTATAPLLGPAFAEGWHPDLALDYPADLGLHSEGFAPVTIAEAEAFLCSHLAIGMPISVFAYSDGTVPSSAHQIHRNDNYPDGAIVVDPTGANPLYLAFRYANQTF